MVAVADSDTAGRTRTNLLPAPGFEAASSTAVARTNLVTNPNFETNTTGWTATGGVLTQDGTQAQSGSSSGLLTTTASGQSMALTSAPAASNLTYTGSVYVRGTGSAQLQILRNGTVFASSATVTLSSSWQRVSVSGALGASTTSVNVQVNQLTSGVNTMNVDGALLEAGGYLGSYFDGSTTTDGNYTYAWTGTANASASTQSAPIPTGWNNTGSAWNNVSVFWRDSSWAASGSFSGMAYCSGSAALQGFNKTVTGLPAGKVFTVSATINNLSGTGVTVHLRDTTNVIDAASPVVAAGTVQRVSASITTGVTGNVTLLVAFTAANATGTPTLFAVDSAMVEQSPVLLGYVEGTTTAVVETELPGVLQSDTAAGLEVQSLVVSRIQTDSAAASDTQSIAVVQIQTDPVAGTDTQSIVVTQIQTDSAAGTDTPLVGITGTDIAGRTRTNLAGTGNSSFETDLTGWATTSTITRDTAQSFIGAASMRLDSVSAGQIAYGSLITFTGSASTTYTASGWVRGTGTAQLKMANTPGGAVIATSAMMTLTGSWQRITCTGTSSGTATFVYPLFYQQSSGSNSLWIDAALLETGSALLSYIEGTVTAVVETESAGVSQSDTAAGTEVQTGVSAQTQTDTAAATDTQNTAAVAVQSDTGTAAETQTAGNSLTQTDTAAGADTSTLSAVQETADTCAGVEASLVQALLADSDTVAGSDGQILFQSLASIDTVVAADSASVTAVTITDSDAGSAADDQVVGLTDTDDGTDGFLGGMATAASIDNWVGYPVRVSFTVTTTTTITQVSIKPGVTGGFAGGGFAGIASDFSHTSTIPWLGKSSVSAGGVIDTWSTFILDVPVVLVPGTTYSFVCTDTQVGVTDSNPAGSGVVVLSNRSMVYGTSFDNNIAAYTMLYQLLGPTAVHTASESQTVSVSGTSITSSDFATAIETQTVTASITNTDSITTTDTTATATTFTATDSAAATETTLLTTALTVQDTAAGTETNDLEIVGGDAFLERSDTVTATDTHILAVTLIGTDTAVITDTTLTPALSDSDISTALDDQDVAETFLAADSDTSTATEDQVVGITTADQSTTTDTAALPPTFLTQTDQAGRWRSNLISNPSFETDTTGWTVSGSAAAMFRDTTKSFAGSASLQLSSSSFGFGTLHFLPIPISSSSGVKYKVSAYVMGTGTAALEVRTYNPGFSGNGLGTSTTTTLTSSWQRISVTVTTDGTSAQAELRINSGSGAHLCQVDAVLFEAGTALFPYIEGSATFAATDTATVAAAVTQFDTAAASDTQTVLQHDVAVIDTDSVSATETQTIFKTNLLTDADSSQTAETSTITAQPSAEEATGDTQNIQLLSGYTHILASPAHSRQAPDGYRDAPLTTFNQISYERWIRVSPDLVYGTISGTKFWADDLIVPSGWSLKWGTTDIYATPVNTVSTIALYDVPDGVPGISNCGGLMTAGIGTQFSDWVVLQAQLTDLSLAESGPLLADLVSEVGDPVMIHYHFTFDAGDTILAGEVGASLDSATLTLHGTVQSENTVRPDTGTETEQVTPLIPYYV